MKQALRSKTTKDSILKAAAIYLAEKGYNKTDVDEICKKASVTKGAFYHHFSSKQELFLEMLDLWMKRVASQLDLNELKPKNTLELLLSIPGKFKPVFEEVDSQLPIFLELYIKSISDPELNKIVLKSYNDFLTFFTVTIKKGIGEGSIKKVNPDDAAKVLFSLTIGLLMQGLLNPEGEDWVELSKKSIRLILASNESLKLDNR
ncbi:MAG: TetR/AcrR family transcriptional regulator [Actinobacteria bacterium]|nr:TetR/AcrR family transcriptional regulator [Actinomycetota bacterium]